MTCLINKKNCHFSKAVSETTKDGGVSKRENVGQLDMQEAFLASGRTESSKGGTSGAKAKGRGAR